jgi:2'-5' RNA ligase
MKNDKMDRYTEEFMEYAITLYFDKTAEDKINDLVYKIAESNGNKYMLENNIKPHITIAYFEYNKNINSIIELLDKNIPILNMGIGQTFLGSIGTFIPAVLFISPVINNYLLNFNKKANELLEKNKKIKFIGFYLENKWVPHVSLGVKLNKNELLKGMEILVNNYQNIFAEVNKIALVECNPYKEIKTWKL